MRATRLFPGRGAPCPFDGLRAPSLSRGCALAPDGGVAPAGRTKVRPYHHTPPSGHPSREGTQVKVSADRNPLSRGVARSAGVCSPAEGDAP